LFHVGVAVGFVPNAISTMWVGAMSGMG
jgi:hypothetical protein